ncbi:NAD(P)-dependent oxidoreductase [Georgenia sp. SYP-B2076]|uniref:NAD(P)-dependent oxidoreductase n=1 Tax=Georgenia sp. SYP-B2076 TaxID=2495881 RepID=UPI000F8EE44F|nr:NAD(P)-dependent oxidoreductase [Georgenia sp. SYP-B2076]
MEDIGLIGLGVMGRPMAGHLLRRCEEEGCELVVTSRRSAAAAGLLDAGARWAENPRELAGRCGIVIVMVPDLPQVREVLEGEDGLLAGLAGPTVLVISSTVSPEGVRELASELGERSDGRLTVVDAPVSGGEEGAVAGTLSVMVGGADADVARVLPWLAATGTAVHLGPLGAGQVAKACNQLIVAAEVVALAEASVIAERAGLDVAALFALLQGGYAGSRIMEVKAHRFAQHDHTPSGPAKFMIKDLSFALDEARRTSVGAQQLPLLRQIFTELTEQGLGDYDTSVTQEYVERRSPAAPA